MINRQVVLAARPVGFPVDSDFRLVENPVPVIADGQFLIRGEYLSVDPYMRGRMNDTASYAEPLAIGEVMVGELVGRVVESKHRRFKVGRYVTGMFGWQEYAVSNGEGVRKLNPALAPVSTALHVLGMPGLTAYFGLTQVCAAARGEALLVTGAAGAVGSAAGQIAKILGCHVVGTTGSDEKVAYLKEDLGYDDAFNYKSSGDYAAQLQERFPDGIDLFFDNVGGPVSDAAFPLLNVGARVGICGQISQYNADRQPVGPRLFGHLIVKRATVRGFLVLDFIPMYREALTQLYAWYGEGKLACRERVTEGIENAPRAFLEMMQGANIGKQLVKL